MEIAVVFLPLAAAILAGGLVRSPVAAMVITCGAVTLAAVLSLPLLAQAIAGRAETVTLFEWMPAHSTSITWALRIDTLSAVMISVVTSVSAAVHIYAVGYMSHDHHRARFFAYLSLFTFAMLALVTADNLVQMFFGWEGVGLASYLLIGFWFHKDSANSASIKAFLVNRVGDIGFALGIFAAIAWFGSASFDQLFADPQALATQRVPFLGADIHALSVVCFLLFIGAMGKSAQIGLHTWLPDAMEGPTPVSALIHAATMVTAGVFMLARLSPLLEHTPELRTVIVLVGVATCFIAATIGMTQFDIKRVVAYSTMSQLGYMVFAAGLGAYPVAIFHLMTHAFFKALLFLGAGSVIHALSDEQDMRNMGGLAKTIPITYTVMWIGTLALAGIGIPGLIGFAGFYSKDLILEVAGTHHTWVGTIAFIIGLIVALLTALYSTRLMMLTFHGPARADEAILARAHESPPIMLAPLIFLAVGSVLVGVIAVSAFAGDDRTAFWGASIALNETIGNAHHAPLWMKIAPVAMGLIGILAGWLVYGRAPNLAANIATRTRVIYQLFFRKWYFDEIYEHMFVRPAWSIGQIFWQTGDRTIIDGAGPHGLAALTKWGAARLVKIQTGYIYHYAFAMLIGLVLLLFVLWGGW
ncbi:MAG: NADH-quinone oxidoreductase subunit L [Pseudomonadota bacterium]